MADTPILPQSWYGKPILIAFRDDPVTHNAVLVDATPAGILVEHGHVPCFYPWHMVVSVREDRQ